MPAASFARPAVAGDGTGGADDAVRTCLQVVADYHDAIDRGTATAALRFVADGAEFEMRGQQLTGQGLADFLAAREAQTDRFTFHHLVEQRVVNRGPGSITLGGRVLVYGWSTRGAYDLERILDITHELHPVDGAWLIARRTSRPLHPAATTALP